MDVTGFPETGPDQGRRRDHRLPGGALRRAGHPARAHQRAADRQGAVPRHRAARFGGLRPRACRPASSRRPGRAPDGSATSIRRWRRTSRTPRADGQVVVAVANPRLWSRFCAAVGAEALEHDPRFATNSDRLANRDALNARHPRSCSRDKTVDSLLERLTRRRRAVRPRAHHRRGARRIRSSPPAQMLVDIPAGERSR